MAAAPKVAARVGSNGTGSSTFTVNVPVSSYTDGDTILVHLCSADVTHTPPSGDWVEVKTYQDVGLSRVSTFALRSDGSAGGGTVAFTGGSAAPFAAVTHHVTGAPFGVIVASTGVDGASQFPAPDEVTAGWEGLNNLFMAVAGWVDDDESATDFPSLYLHSAEDYQSGGGTNAGAGIGVATRRYRADSDTPSPFGLSGSEAWSAYTLVMPSAPIADTVTTDGPAGLEASLFLDGSWRDIGEDRIYHRDGVSVRHGRSAWIGQAEPASCQLTVRNVDGAFSPDYPSSDTYGFLKRNTKMRAGRARGDSYLEWTGTASKDVAYTPDDASLDITGDIDLRMEIQPHRSPLGETNAVQMRLLDKVDAFLGYRLVLITTDSELNLRFVWFDSSNATFASDIINVDPAGVGDYMGQRFAFRVTLDVSTGEVEWFLSDSIGGSWTSVGSEVKGATDIGSSAGDLYLGGEDGALNQAFHGRIYAAQVLDGIDGTPALDVDFTTETPGTQTFTDDAGLDWTVGIGGRISNTQWRFHGEIGDLPTNWDLSGNDQWLPIEASGLLRRLRQGGDVLQSPLRRGIVRGVLEGAAIHSYWPMEEKGDQSLTRLSNAIAAQLWVLQSGTPDPANATPFQASDALLRLDDSRWHVVVDPPASTSGDWMVRFLIHLVEAPASDVELLHVVTGDLEYRVNLDTDGSVYITTYREGALVHTGSDLPLGLLDGPKRVSLAVETNGTGVDAGLLAQEPGGVVGGGGDTFANAVASYPTFIRMNENADAGDVLIGHMTVESEYRGDGFDEELNAYDGERAAARIARLLQEEGIAYAIRGVAAESTALGPQGVKSLVQLIEEAADTDLGILHDSLDMVGLFYRTGASLRDQDPAISIDYDAGEADGVPELIRDDADFANEVVVTNWDKSTARAELTDGEQSTAEPPDGVGRYDVPYDVNLYAGESLQGHAETRLRLHSPDLPRLASFGLATHLVAADIDAILALRPGDKIALSDLPATIYPRDLDQLLQGWTEDLTSHTHRFAINTTPAQPWDHGKVEQTDDIRYDTSGSFLVTGEDAGATTLYVAGYRATDLWTVVGANFPFDVMIEGVRVTVTAVSGLAFPQTFTVSAIPRALSGGADIRLADPAYYSL